MVEVVEAGVQVLAGEVQRVQCVQVVEVPLQARDIAELITSEPSRVTMYIADPQVLYVRLHIIKHLNKQVRTRHLTYTLR